MHISKSYIKLSLPIALRVIRNIYENHEYQLIYLQINFFLHYIQINNPSWYGYEGKFCDICQDTAVILDTRSDSIKLVRYGRNRYHFERLKQEEPVYFRAERVDMRSIYTFYTSVMYWFIGLNSNYSCDILICSNFVISSLPPSKK